MKCFSNTCSFKNSLSNWWPTSLKEISQILILGLIFDNIKIIINCLPFLLKAFYWLPLAVLFGWHENFTWRFSLSITNTHKCSLHFWALFQGSCEHRLWNSPCLSARPFVSTEPSAPTWRFSGKRALRDLTRYNFD